LGSDFWCASRSIRLAEVLAIRPGAKALRDGISRVSAQPPAEGSSIAKARPRFPPRWRLVLAGARPQRGGRPRAADLRAR
jgi:hypothetical protein